MGNGASASTSTSVNALKATSEAYVSAIQDIAQGAALQQIVNMDCQSDGGSKNCKFCLDEMKKIWSPQETVDKCAPLCTCSVTGVDIREQVTLNMQSSQVNAAEETFKNQVSNSIFAQLNESQTEMFGSAQQFLFGSSQSKQFQKEVDNIWQEIKTTSVQDSLQQIKTLQIIDVRGPTHIYNVNLDVAIDYVSTVFQSNDTISQSILNIQNYIEAAVTVETGPITALIEIIVRLVLLVVVVIALIYAINLGIDVLMLYSSV